MSNSVGNIIERWMTIYFVIRRFIKAFCVVGIRGMNVLALNYPYAYTFLSPGINVACIFHRHPGIGRVEAANMLMIKTLFATNEDFP